MRRRWRPLQHHRLSLLPAILIVWALQLSSAQMVAPCFPGRTSYVNLTSSPYILTTPGFTTQATYPANMSCQYVFQASAKNSRIHVRVRATELEQPLFSTCADYISIRDGGTVMAREIVRFCGVSNPRTISSSGDSLMIAFHSDEVVQRKGASFVVQEYVTPGCGPEWIQNDDLPYCYRLETSAPYLTWIDAQNVCVYEDSNLLTITSQQEYDFIYDTFERNQSLPWVGYNDIQAEGTIASINPKEIVWPQPLPSLRGNNELKNCVFFDFSVTEGMAHSADDCRARHPFICKRNKDGSSIAMPGPRMLLRRGKIAHVMDTTIWILIIICTILFFLCLCIFLRKPCKEYMEKRSNNRVDTVSQNQRLVSNLASTDASLRPAPATRIGAVTNMPPPPHQSRSAARTARFNEEEQKLPERLPPLIERELSTTESRLGHSDNDLPGSINVPIDVHRNATETCEEAQKEVSPPVVNERSVKEEAQESESVVNEDRLQSDHNWFNRKQEEENEGKAQQSSQSSVNIMTTSGGGQSVDAHPKPSAYNTGELNLHLPPVGTIRETTFVSGHEESFMSKSKRAMELFERPKTKPLDNVSAISLDEFWRSK